MDSSLPYVAIAIASLLLIFALVFFLRKDKRGGMSRLASLAFAFVIAGIVFGDDRLVGYSLIGLGVFLAVVDVFWGKKSG